jgi:hypothetical protein
MPPKGSGAAKGGKKTKVWALNIIKLKKIYKFFSVFRTQTPRSALKRHTSCGTTFLLMILLNISIDDFQAQGQPSPSGKARIVGH